MVCFVIILACPVIEGMGSPQLIPDDRITSTPESDTVKNVRPGNAGQWVEDADKEPTITVVLVSEDEEPVPMGVIKVTGNVPSFSVLYMTAEDEPTPVTKPGTEEPQVKPFTIVISEYCIDLDELESQASLKLRHSHSSSVNKIMTST